MGKNKSKHFNTYEEAAEWFNSHDMADLEDQLKPVDFLMRSPTETYILISVPQTPIKR